MCIGHMKSQYTYPEEINTVTDDSITSPAFEKLLITKYSTEPNECDIKISIFEILISRVTGPKVKKNLPPQSVDYNR